MERFVARRLTAAPGQDAQEVYVVIDTQDDGEGGRIVCASEQQAIMTARIMNYNYPRNRKRTQRAASTLPGEALAQGGS